MIILSCSATVTPIKGLPGDEDQQFVALSAYVGTGGSRRSAIRHEISIVNVFMIKVSRV